MADRAGPLKRSKKRPGTAPIAPEAGTGFVFAPIHLVMLLIVLAEAAWFGWFLHETLPNFARHKAQLDKASGVSGWVLHDLRRTFASGLASLGVPIPVVEKLLNHVSGTFSGIVGVYHRYDYAKEMREAVELWEKHIQTLTA